jgi:hypothetical protein
VTQLELDVEVRQGFTVVRDGRRVTVASEEDVWQVIGQSWSPYAVYDKRGEICAQFIPY